MRGVVIFGAGGHGQVVADILLRAHEEGRAGQPIGFVDDDPRLAGKTILGLPVFGTVSQLGQLDYDGIIVAIGHNRIRARIFHAICAREKKIINAVHPSAIMAPDVSLGRGVMISAGVIVNTGSTIAHGAIVNTGSTVDHHNSIGAMAHVAPGANLGGNVIVGEGALIGIGAAIIPGRSIGNWSTVGAGAVVTRDVPPYCVAVGVPAKVVKRYEPEEKPGGAQHSDVQSRHFRGGH